MTAEEIQKKALSLVESTPRLAAIESGQYLAEASTPETHRALLSKFLLEDRPENVAAQVAIYGSPMATTQIKASLEAYFSGLVPTLWAGFSECRWNNLLVWDRSVRVGLHRGSQDRAWPLVSRWRQEKPRLKRPRPALPARREVLQGWRFPCQAFRERSARRETVRRNR